MIRSGLWSLLILLITSTAVAGELTWLTDLEQGRRQAREEGKDLLVLFTGTSWCYHCGELDYDVLNRADFARIANTLVLVKLEFPFSHDLLPAENKDQYIAWRREFGIVGFPTLFLADSQGRPYVVTGNTGEPVKEYVAQLEGLQVNRSRRDSALEAASKATGLDAAKHLNQALDAVAAGFDPDFKTTEGSYLAWFYRPEIDRLLAADPDDALGLKAKYRAILDNTEQKRVDALLEQLATTRREQGEDAAIELVRSELGRADSHAVADQLRVSLVDYLASAERYSEALEAATQFAALPQVEPNRRRIFRQQAASYLKKLGRLEEALAMLEAAIHEVGESHPRALRTYQTKAEELAKLGRLDEAEATWKRAERCARPGTMNWREVQIFRGRLLSKLARHSEALAVFTDLVADTEIGPTDRALALGELAVALGLAGQQAQAELRSEEAESLLEGTSSPAELELAGFIRGRLRLARGEPASSE